MIKIFRSALLAVFALALCPTITLADGDSVKNEPALSHEALAVILSEPLLRKYFHEDTNPERFPLRIVDNADLGLEVGEIDLGGITAVIQGEEDDPDGAAGAEILIDGVEQGNGFETISFRFPIEGVTGTARIARSFGELLVAGMNIVEQ